MWKLQSQWYMFLRTELVALPGLVEMMIREVEGWLFNCFFCEDFALTSHCLITELTHFGAAPPLPDSKLLLQTYTSALSDWNRFDSMIKRGCRWTLDNKGLDCRSPWSTGNHRRPLGWTNDRDGRWFRSLKELSLSKHSVDDFTWS